MPIGVAIKSVKYAFSWDEVIKILNLAYEDCKKKNNFRNYALLVTLALSGRRVSEIVGDVNKVVKVYWVKEDGKIDRSKWKMIKLPIHGLRIKDIDFKNGVITWTIEKKLIRRKIPNSWEIVQRPTANIEAHPYLLKVLKLYIETNLKDKNPEYKLFPITKRFVYKLVKKYVDKAGIKGRQRIVHAFRHAFAIRLAQVSKTPEDIMKVKELLQHSDVNVTLSYLRFTDTNIRDLLKRI